MKIVVQRVSEASVQVENEQIGKINHGLMLLVGVHKNDQREQMQWLAEKLLKLRIFDDREGKMNHSVQDVKGDILVVPQFTLFGAYEQGNRPSFMDAAKPDKAKKLYNEMIQYFKKHSELTIENGRFGTLMDVQLHNDGPVTLVLEH